MATEANTFSPLPASISGYKETVFLTPGEHPEDTPLTRAAPLWVARCRSTEEGFVLIERDCFAASPAGTINRQDCEFLRDEILAQFKAAADPGDGAPVPQARVRGRRGEYWLDQRALRPGRSGGQFHVQGR